MDFSRCPYFIGRRLLKNFWRSQRTGGQKPFIEIIDKILAITQGDDYLENTAKQANVHEYEKEIDELVYKLYGLTDEEIKIVEGD